MLRAGGSPVGGGGGYVLAPVAPPPLVIVKSGEATVEIIVGAAASVALRPSPNGDGYAWMGGGAGGCIEGAAIDDMPTQ